MQKQKKFEWFLFGGTAFIIGIIPFIVLNNSFFPFITGKNFFFRIATELLGILWICGYLKGFFPKIKKSPVLLALMSFLGLAIISTIFSVDPFRSFWSNFERMEGLVTYLHFGVYVLVLASVFRTNMWDLIWATSLGGSVAMSFFALYQFLGFAVINQGGGRVDGTFGNAIYLAVYMLFNIFITLLYFRRTYIIELPKTEKITMYIAGASLFVFLGAALSHALNTVVAFLIALVATALIFLIVYIIYRKKAILTTRVFYGALLLLQTLILFCTGTRGAVLRLAVGLFTIALVSAFSKQVFAVEKRYAYILLLLCILSVGSFFVLRNIPSVVTSNPIAGRILGSSFRDNTLQARLLIWNMALQGSKEHPVLGWGLEGFRNVFDKYYNPQMYAQEQWFDRTHNILFDWLISGGVLGLVSYLSLFGTLIWMVIRRVKELGGEYSIFLGLLAGYFVHNLFVFDNVGSLILFGALIAYVHTRTHDAEKKEETKSSPSLRIYGQFAAIGFGIFCLVVNLYQMYANYLLVSALQKAQQDPTQAIKAFTDTIQSNSYGKIETREQLVQYALSVSNANIPVETKQAIANLAATQELESMKAQPNDARTWLFASILWRQFGKYPEAEEYMRKAVALSPKKQTLRIELVNILIAEKKFDEAYTLAKETFTLAPEFDQARVVYASAAIYAGKKTEANTLLQGRDELLTDSTVIRSYVETKNYSDALSLLVSAEKKAPLSEGQAILLASVYLSSGRQSDCIQELQKLVKQSPSRAKDIEAAIVEIKAGRNPFR